MTDPSGSESRTYGHLFQKTYERLAELQEMQRRGPPPERQNEARKFVEELLLSKYRVRQQTER
jgi:hypothetical protein